MMLSTCILSNTVNSDVVFDLYDALKVKHSQSALNLYTV